MRRTLIHCGTIITMDAQNTLLRDGYIGIEGQNIAFITQERPEIEAPYDEMIDATQMAVLPGLIDIHTHVCGSLFKGMLEDLPDGFYKAALPMEDQLTPERIYALSLLGASECLLGGITLINDLYHGMDSTARAVHALGMRAVLATKIFETDLARLQYRDYTRDPDAGWRRVEENIALIETWHQKGDGRILCKFGPHATDTVSLELARKIARLAETYGVGCHIHAAQMPQEVDFLRETYGLTPIEYLRESGLLRQNTTIAHCLHITPGDMALLAESGAMLAHCPDMNGNKGGPLAPMREIYAKGICVGYGTDWTGSDLWSTMRMGVTVGRLLGCAQTERNALDALRRCTILPARHLGLDHLIGSLEVGKRADLVMVDLRSPNLCPMGDDPIATLVYNANCHDVHSVMVDGEMLVKERKLTRLSLRDVLREGQRAADAIRADASV